jgi:hemerythrin
MKLSWKQAYATGIPELDEHHRGLLDLINVLDEYREHRPDDREVFSTLNTLVKYAEDHFASEEGYMERFKYPNISVHRREHVLFLGTVFRFAEMLENKDSSVFPEMVAFLREWYGSHIGGSDREYREYFVSKRFVRTTS